MKQLLLTILTALALTAEAATNAVRVEFPLESFFGGGKYVKGIKLQAVNPLLGDGATWYAGSTLSVLPQGGTNPIVSLAPNDYWLTFGDITNRLKLQVYYSTGLLNAVDLVTNGVSTYYPLTITANGLTNGQTNVTLSGTFSGDGSGLTGTGISSNTVQGMIDAGTASLLATNGNGGRLTNLNPNAITNAPWLISTSNAWTGTFTGNGSGLTNLSHTLFVPSVALTVTWISSPVQYQVIQRTNATTGAIAVAVLVAGPTGTGVEARFNGGTWQALSASDNYGVSTGLVAGAVGSGLMEARITGGATSATVSNVSVGDVFAIWGQSNGSGRLSNNIIYTNLNVAASLYGNDYVWRSLVDPTDSSTGQVDAVSSDTDQAGMGSVWPAVANWLAMSNHVPVAFVPCAKGSTAFPEWSAGADPFDRTTLFGSGLYRVRATGARAVLWWQGEGGFDDTTGAVYTSPFSAMASNAVANVPGLKFIPCKLQECVGISSARLTNGWYAVGLLWASNTNVLRGPTLADSPPGSAENILTEYEGSATPYYHLKTATNGWNAAYRWATNLHALFP